MSLIKTLSLFSLTAIAEIVGCYLPYLWLRHGKSVWLNLPSAVSLMAFVWLLTLHPAPAGRVYAAYAGVYLVVAMGVLWLIDGVVPTGRDILGAVLALTGMAIIMSAPVR